MILHVSYVYEAVVTPPRKRGAQMRHYLAQTTVEIPETTSDDLPVAFQVQRRKGPFDDAPPEETVRWNPETGLWQESVTRVRERGKADELTPRDAHWLAARVDARSEIVRGRGDDPLGLVPDSVRSMDRTPGFMEDDPLRGKLHSSAAEERAAEIRAAAGRLLIMDGWLMEPCAEPVYGVSEPASIFDVDGICRLDVARLGEREEEDARNLYRADERDIMLGSRKFADRNQARIEVVIPEAVKAPLPEMALVGVAKEVLSLLEDDLKGGDRAFFSAFADVRDALRAILAAPPGDAPHGAGELARAIQDSIPACTLASGGHPEWILERINLAVDRYDAFTLAMTMDGADHPALPGR